MSKNNFVKLYIYQIESEKTYIEAIEAESFNDFIIARFNGNSESVDFENMSMNLKEAFPDKKVLLVPHDLDLMFYGIEKVEEENNGSGSFDRELQHEEITGETS